MEVRNLRKTYGHVVAGPERSGQEHHRGLVLRLPLVVVLYALAHKVTRRSAARGMRESAVDGHPT